jgi:Alpha/beta hydrolase domain
MIMKLLRLRNNNYTSQKRILKTLIGTPLLTSITIMTLVLSTLVPASAATFVETTSEPFGRFGGVEFVRYTGRFVGTTALGAYRMAFEIVVPADPGRSNGTVLIEPPHFIAGNWGRDFVLGQAFVFGHGFSYATVGFGTVGLNILDPAATDLVLAGEPVRDLGPGPVTDFDILVQFVQALSTEPFAVAALGVIERKAGYGGSETAEVWEVVFHRPGGQGLLDFTLLDRDVWRSPSLDVVDPAFLENLPQEFTPLTGIGKVIFVLAEADQLISSAAQLRRSVVGPDADPGNYRLYEIAGAPHIEVPPPFNPLDFHSVVRAMLLAGDQWVRAATPPPPSALLAQAPPGAIDPVYGFETGIARDAELNALGGIRFPDVEVGRALFIASQLDFEIIPGFPGLVGAWFDLQCVPLADGSSRFASHGDYVQRVVRQANALYSSGFLLEADAVALIQQASQSEVGNPNTCAR